MQFIPTEAIHPGEILKQDFLVEYSLSVDQAAAGLGMRADNLEAIVNGTGQLTAEIALRFARYFETSPEFWLNLQRSYDLSIALKSVNGLDKIRPVRAA